MSHKKRKEYPEAYDEGIDAYLDGKSLNSNPYTPPKKWSWGRDNAWLWWRRGWFGWSY